jgi:hypothetical protein
MSKQTRLHFVQVIEPSAALRQPINATDSQLQEKNAYDSYRRPCLGMIVW